MATPCWPAPVSAMTRVLPRRRVSSAWPSALLILCAPGVREVLALQVEANLGRGRAACQPGGLRLDGARKAVRPIQGRRPPGEAGEQFAQVGPEHRVVAERRVGRFELLERGHQRLGHVAAAEVALHPPSTGGVRLEQRGVDGRRAEGSVRAVVACGLGALHEQGDAERILARPLPGDARRLDAAGHVHADGRDRPQRLGDVGRVQATGEDGRHLPRDGHSPGHRSARACPPAGSGGRSVDQQSARHRRPDRPRRSPGLAPTRRHRRCRPRSGCGRRARPAGSLPPATRRLRRPPTGWRRDRPSATMDATSSGARVGDHGDDRGRCSGGAATRASRASSAASPRASRRGDSGARLSPMASAPARTAASTPSASVTPQILTKGRRATFAGSSGSPASADERARPPRRDRRIA